MKYYDLLVNKLHTFYQSLLYHIVSMLAKLTNSFMLQLIKSKGLDPNADPEANRKAELQKLFEKSAPPFVKQIPVSVGNKDKAEHNAYTNRVEPPKEAFRSHGLFNQMKDSYEKGDTSTFNSLVNYVSVEDGYGYAENNAYKDGYMQKENHGLNEALEGLAGQAGHTDLMQKLKEMRSKYIKDNQDNPVMTGEYGSDVNPNATSWKDMIKKDDEATELTESDFLPSTEEVSNTLNKLSDEHDKPEEEEKADWENEGGKPEETPVQKDKPAKTGRFNKGLKSKKNDKKSLKDVKPAKKNSKAPKLGRPSKPLKAVKSGLKKNKNKK